MKKILFSSLYLAASLLTQLAFANTIDTVTLENDVWRIDIAPQSLAVIAQPKGSAAVHVSKGQAGLGNVTALVQQRNLATWKLSETSLSVRAELIEEVLSIEFISETSGNLTWPMIQDTPSLRGYIVPFFEGSYVPTDDVLWQDFLHQRGAISTTAGLSMPFWGLDFGEWTLTYILTNPFNNQLQFNKMAELGLGMQVSHAFTPNWAQKTYGMRIVLGAGTPVTPAKHYRQELMDNSAFVSFAEKVERLPAAEKLLGAAHIYLWGGQMLSRYDVTDWKTFAVKLHRRETVVTQQIWSRLNADARKTVKVLVQSERSPVYAQRVLSGTLSEILEERSFGRWFQATLENLDVEKQDASIWSQKHLEPEVAALLSQDVSSLSHVDVYRLNSLLLYAVFAEQLRHPDEWGDGVSIKLLEQFVENGLDRLWLGMDSWLDGFRHPTAVQKAKALGYLIAPYDSYHSIHHPQEPETWETAQFDLELYEQGAIVNADGRKNKGFKQKGYHLSPLVARPYVERRVNGIFSVMPSDFNSWFIDCDAYGELFDDYSPAHTATQFDDMQARLARMAWIRDTYQVVVGSEGGAAYAAATLHFAHGMMAPVIGWGDADMKEKGSPYYIGGYWPPDAPAIHVKQVPLKPLYFHLYFDPRFRLPLYQLVFHDSLVTTNHWGSGSLKFKEAVETLRMLELLYNVPPLYHLNIAEFSKHKETIKKHYAFFSPLHREIGGQPMTDFEWLSQHRQVQRTEFAGTVEIFANFGTVPFKHVKQVKLVIPGRTVVARWIQTGDTQMFSIDSTLE